MLTLSLVIATLVLAPSRPAAANPFGIDLTGPTVAEAQAHLRASGLDQVAGRMLTRHTTAVPGPAGLRWGAGSTTSSNWSGYVADMNTNGNQVGEARGFFQAEPVFTTPAVGSFAGIGGYRGQNLWQTGLDQYQMQLWIELYPTAPAYFTIPVSSNDTIFSDVWETSPGTYNLMIQNYTTGQYALGSAGCCPDLKSAEWITEAQPGTPIPFFSSVPFSQSFYYLRNNGTVQLINSPVAQTYWNVKLVNGSSCIHASSLFPDNQSFSTGLGC
ncbi:MAG: G1 family endopeptidase [Chloroflexota bacterium]|nr:G1 family endopeptidase [Chloroflexota bacterium]